MYPLFCCELGCSHKHTFNGSMLLVVTFDIHYYFKLQTCASFKRRKSEGLVLLISGIVRACQKSQCGWGVVVFPENNYVLEHL